MKQLEIDYTFGYVFDKSKLIVMYPVGSNVIPFDEYEVEVEAEFLKDGIENAFDENDIKVANKTIKPLEMFLNKPNKIIPFVTCIKDFDTKDELENLTNEFNQKYEILDYYIKKDYKIKDIYEVFKNVQDYIPNENLDNLNILKIKKDKFDMDKFINTSRKNLEKIIDYNLIPISTKKSSITDRLYIKCNNNSSSKYISFARYIDLNSKEILCANQEILTDLEVDMGDLELSNIREVGYLLNEESEYITFKIVNYILNTENGNQVAQIVDYSGVFKPMMIEFINNFIID